MKNYTVFGMLLIHFMVDRGMSTADLAVQSKISYPHLSNMLRGEKNITQDAVKKISNTLKLSRLERSKLREAAFMSNKVIRIENDGIPYYTLRLIYFLVQKKNTLSKANVELCKKMLISKLPTDQSESSSSET